MSDDRDMTPLFEATIDDITAELQRRYAHFVVIWQREHDADMDIFDFRYRGGLMPAIAMTDVVHHLMRARFKPREEEP